MNLDKGYLIKWNLSEYGKLISYMTSNIEVKSAMGFNDGIWNNVATYFEGRYFIGGIIWKQSQLLLVL